jgi:hypothetical protein
MNSYVWSDPDNNRAELTDCPSHCEKSKNLYFRARRTTKDFAYVRVRRWKCLCEKRETETQPRDVTVGYVTNSLLYSSYTGGGGERQ